MRTLGETLCCAAAFLVMIVMIWAIGTVILTGFGVVVLLPFVTFEGPMEGGVNFAPIDAVAPYAARIMAAYMAICAVMAAILKGRAP